MGAYQLVDKAVPPFQDFNDLAFLARRSNQLG